MRETIDRKTMNAIMAPTSVDKRENFLPARITERELTRTYILISFSKYPSSTFLMHVIRHASVIQCGKLNAYCSNFSARMQNAKRRIVESFTALELLYPTSFFFTTELGVWARMGFLLINL